MTVLKKTGNTKTLYSPLYSKNTSVFSQSLKNSKLYLNTESELIFSILESNKPQKNKINMTHINKNNTLTSNLNYDYLNIFEKNVSPKIKESFIKNNIKNLSNTKVYNKNSNSLNTINEDYEINGKINNTQVIDNIPEFEDNKSKNNFNSTSIISVPKLEQNYNSYKNNKLNNFNIDDIINEDLNNSESYSDSSDTSENFSIEKSKNIIKSDYFSPKKYVGEVQIIEKFSEEKFFEDNITEKNKDNLEQEDKNQDNNSPKVEENNNTYLIILTENYNENSDSNEKNLSEIKKLDEVEENITKYNLEKFSSFKISSQKTQEEEINETIQVLKKVVKELRAVSPYKEKYNF